MSDHARVDSVDTLREFRAVLWKFAEVGKAALGDAEGELSRTLMWLEHEQATYWAGQVRKRQQLVARATEKLREKKTFKDATGRLPSFVDEEKAWKVARARLEEAEAKAAAVKKYVRVLQKASDDYKGSVQGFASTVAHGIPVAVARLDKLAGLLRQYVELAPAGGGGAESAAGTAGGAGASTTAMARPADATPAPDDDLPDFPALEPPAVVLVHTHRPTGLILAADGKSPAGDGDQYRRFADPSEAEGYAHLFVDADPLIECAIYGADKVRLAVVAAGESKTESA